jgi:glycosyltransferase involved in cell wall biosynthesis
LPRPCPHVSIVTPSFNQARYVERTIRSVLEQDLGDRTLEYSIVDGGSSDGTLDILQRYSTRLNWVSEPDRGQAHAVNKGFRNTSGEIVGWLNSDDVYYPNALRNVAELFDAHPEADILYGNADHIDENDSLIEPYYTEPWDFERLKEVCFLSQPAVFMRRRSLIQAGDLDERLHFCLDYEYWIRQAQLGAIFLYAPVTLAGSRLYPDTKTMGQRLRFHVEINDMLRRRFGRVPDRWLFNYAHAVLEQRRIDRAHALRFAAAVSVVAIWAALRWNRRVSPSMLTTTRGWVVGSARATLARRAVS